MEARRQLLGVSPLGQCGLLQGSNSGHQVWQQLPLSPEPYYLLGIEILVHVLGFQYWSAKGHILAYNLKDSLPKSTAIPNNM